MPGHINISFPNACLHVVLLQFHSVSGIWLSSAVCLDRFGTAPKPPLLLLDTCDHGSSSLSLWTALGNIHAKNYLETPVLCPSLAVFPALIHHVQSYNATLSLVFRLIHRELHITMPCCTLSVLFSVLEEYTLQCHCYTLSVLFSEC